MGERGLVLPPPPQHCSTGEIRARHPPNVRTYRSGAVDDGRDGRKGFGVSFERLVGSL